MICMLSGVSNGVHWRNMIGIQSVILKHVAEVGQGKHEICKAPFHLDDDSGSVAVVSPVGWLEGLLDLRHDQHQTGTKGSGKIEDAPRPKVQKVRNPASRLRFGARARPDPPLEPGGCRRGDLVVSGLE